VGYAFRAKSVENDTLNSLTCGNGEVPKWNGSDWACSTDADSGGDITGVTAGTGLTGGGASGNVNIAADTAYLQRRVLSLCAPGQSIRVINANGSVICEVDTDTNTTYTAGSGLNLAGTTFSIAPDGINSSHLGDNSVGPSQIAGSAVRSEDIATNAVGSSEIATGAVGSSEVQDNSLTANDLASNSVGIDELTDFAKGVGVNGIIIVHASRFQEATSNSPFFLLSTGYIRPSAINQLLCLVAPVELPHGVTVTHFEVSFWDGSASQDFTFNLDRLNFSNGAKEPLGSVTTSGNLSQVRVGTDDTIQNSVVNGSLYSYLIHGCITSDAASPANTRLYAARIRYN